MTFIKIKKLQMVTVSDANPVQMPITRATMPLGSLHRQGMRLSLRYAEHVA